MEEEAGRQAASGNAQVTRKHVDNYHWVGSPLEAMSVTILAYLKVLAPAINTVICQH